MPKTADEVFRDFVRFTGDGLPDAPVGKPLPRGDERSGVHNPSKADFREWANGFGETVNEYLDQAGEAIDRVDASIDRIDRTDQKGLWSNRFDTLLADTSYTLTPGSLDTVAVGDIIQTRLEGFTYQVVASGGDVVTTGGIQLRAIMKGDASDVPAMGIDRTGATDVTARLQDYLTRRAGDPAYIPDGTYRVNATITAPVQGLDVTCGPNVVFDATAAPAGTFTVVCDGAVGVYSALTAGSADKGNRRIRGTSGFATSLAVGDRLKIRSDDIYDPGRTDSKHGEIVTVTGLADAATGYIDLAEGLAAPYTTNPVAAKLTLRRMKWSGGEFLGAVAEQNNQTAIRTKLCDTPVIERAKFRRFDSRALWIEDCPQPRVRKSEFHDTRPSSTGYGVSLIDATQDGIIEDNLFKDCRHATSTNNQTGAGGIPRRHTIQNNLVIGGAQARGGSMAWGNSIDTHAAAEDIWVKYNTVRGCPGEAAINLECSSGKIIGNIVEDSAQYGILAINQSGVVGEVEIRDNDVRRGGASLRAAYRVSPGGTNANSYYQATTLSGNKALDRAAGPDYQIGGSLLPTLPDVMFAGNYSRGGVQVSAEFFNCRNARVNGNTLRSPVGFQVVRIRQTFYANVSNNVLMVAPSTTSTVPILEISATSSNATVSGNTVTVTSGSTVAPSIVASSDSAGVTITGNNTRGAGAISATGSGAVVANNNS